MSVGYAFWQCRLLFQMHTVILEWGDKRKRLKDEQKPNQFEFWSGWEALLEVTQFNLLLRAGLSSALERVRHGQVLLSVQDLQGWKIQPCLQAACPGPVLPSCQHSSSLWPEHIIPEFGANLVTVEEIHFYPFVELPSSCYGIPLGHSVAAALSEWASWALSAPPTILSAPSKALWPLLGALQFLNIPLEMQGPKLDI